VQEQSFEVFDRYDRRAVGSRIMKLFIFIMFIVCSFGFAKDVSPYRYVKASEAVTDFVRSGDTLIIGTEEGIIDIYDLKSDQLTDKITLPTEKNAWDDVMRSLIFSVDYLDGKLIFIARRFSGWREFYLYENKKLTKLLDESQKFSLKEVKFIDPDTAIIGLMSNELILYDLKNRKIIYHKLLNQASLSDIVLDENRKYLYTSDETPLIYKIDVRNGKIVQKYYKANKRDIFSIDYKSGILLSGGKDRRVILYKTPSKYSMTKGEFFIYEVALNPHATLAAFVKNESDEISVIDTNDLKERYLLKGHKQTIIKIEFQSNNELITADEDDRLFFWRLK
jgi:WD40 repeat protein